MLIEIQKKQWLLIDVLKEATRFLQSHDITNARGNAEQLLSHVLELDRIGLYLRFEQPLSEKERETYKQLLRRRAQQEPLQYLVGQAEFMSLPFRVKPGVLIPRPETEILVEKTIEKVKKQFSHGKTGTCLDIGTGSGNIAVSLAHYLENISIVALDVDEEVLRMAEKNADLNGVGDRIEFVLLDVMDEMCAGQIGRRFDFAISNPPYVSEEEYGQLLEDVRGQEPKIALDGGQDGLRFYRRMAQVLPELLGAGGFALLEIGANQADQIKTIFEKSFLKHIEIIKDLAGRDRIVYLQ